MTFAQKVVPSNGVLRALERKREEIHRPVFVKSINVISASAPILRLPPGIPMISQGRLVIRWTSWFKVSTPVLTSAVWKRQRRFPARQCRWALCKNPLFPRGNGARGRSRLHRWCRPLPLRSPPVLFPLAQRRVHAAVGVLFEQQFVGEQQVVRRGLAGDGRPFSLALRMISTEPLVLTWAMCNRAGGLRGKAALTLGDAVLRQAVHAFDAEPLGYMAFVDDASVDDRKVLAVAYHPQMVFRGLPAAPAPSVARLPGLPSSLTLPLRRVQCGKIGKVPALREGVMAAMG